MARKAKPQPKRQPQGTPIHHDFITPAPPSKPPAPIIPPSPPQRVRRDGRGHPIDPLLWDPVPPPPVVYEQPWWAGS